MRIVTRKEFLLLPPGTLYSRYEPRVVTGLEIKGDSLTSDDWFFRDVLGETGGDCCSNDFEDMEKGKDVPLYLNIEQRDGGFESDALFLVYTTRDVELLVANLLNC